jgi:hypothetical protein
MAGGTFGQSTAQYYVLDVRGVDVGALDRMTNDVRRHSAVGAVQATRNALPIPVRAMETIAASRMGDPFLS